MPKSLARSHETSSGSRLRISWDYLVSRASGMEALSLETDLSASVSWSSFISALPPPQTSGGLRQIVGDASSAVRIRWYSSELSGAYAAPRWIRPTAFLGAESLVAGPALTKGTQISMRHG